MVKKIEYGVGRKKFKTKRGAMNYARKKGVKRIKKVTYEGVISIKKNSAKVYWGKR